MYVTIVVCHVMYVHFSDANKGYSLTLLAYFTQLLYSLHLITLITYFTWLLYSLYFTRSLYSLYLITLLTYFTYLLYLITLLTHFTRSLNSLYLTTLLTYFTQLLYSLTLHCEMVSDKCSVQRRDDRPQILKIWWISIHLIKTKHQ